MKNSSSSPFRRLLGCRAISASCLQINSLCNHPLCKYSKSTFFARIVQELLPTITSPQISRLITIIISPVPDTTNCAKGSVWLAGRGSAPPVSTMLLELSTRFYFSLGFSPNLSADIVVPSVVVNQALVLEADLCLAAAGGGASVHGQACGWDHQQPLKGIVSRDFWPQFFFIKLILLGPWFVGLNHFAEKFILAKLFKLKTLKNLCCVVSHNRKKKFFWLTI
jgi:hypothetical protein